MNIINARLRHKEALYTLELQDGLIKSITAQDAARAADTGDIDARHKLVIPPFVEPHIHLDATLTAGEPEWNMSGTLFEGIARWSQRKERVTIEDTRQRALKTIGMLRDNGVQHVRTHIDVTDPSLTALEAMLMVKKRRPTLSICKSSLFRRRASNPFPADAT
jgi:cytosine deaminase